MNLLATAYDTLCAICGGILLLIALLALLLIAPVVMIVRLPSVVRVRGQLRRGEVTKAERAERVDQACRRFGAFVRRYAR